MYEGVEFVEARGPSYLVEGMVLITGEIHCSTDFEQGFPIHYAEIDGTWQSDPLIHDNQALVVHVREGSYQTLIEAFVTHPNLPVQATWGLRRDPLTRPFGRYKMSCMGKGERRCKHIRYVVPRRRHGGNGNTLSVHR